MAKSTTITAVVIPVLWMALWPLAAVALTPCGDPSAPIFCQNDSVCVDDRPADFSDYELPDGAYHDVHMTALSYHCECPGGWTGVECNIPVESCADDVHFCL